MSESKFVNLVDEVYRVVREGDARSFERVGVLLRLIELGHTHVRAKVDKPE